MKIFTNFLSSLIMAGWVSAIAIFSIQNIQEVSLKFLNFESIKLPIGVLLAFCLGIGFILGSFLPLMWQSSRQINRNNYY
jgi:uncharacterized integral membrane protein